ncbi:MAG: hypothetical protein ACMUIP_02675 [bacterium]
MLLYVGIAFIVGSILFIIIAIAIASFKSNHDTMVKRFENKGNKILTWAMINDLCKGQDCNCRRVMEIFHSAIIDHSPIDGIRYFTKYPYSIFRLFTGHDGHRRALIAHWIGDITQKDSIDDDQIDMAVSILRRMTDSYREYSYTQLIAWNSLAKIAYHKKPLLGNTITMKELLKSLSKDGIESIGAQILVFHLLNQDTPNNENDLQRIIKHIFSLDNFALKATLYSKIMLSTSLPEDKKARLFKGITISRRMADLIRSFEYFSSGYTVEELSIGLKNIGICAPPYDRQSSEGRIVSILLKECLMEVCMPAAIYLFDSDRLKEQSNLNSITLFERDDPRIKRKILGTHVMENLFRYTDFPSQEDRNTQDEQNNKRTGLSHFEAELKNMAWRMAKA